MGIDFHPHEASRLCDVFSKLWEVRNEYRKQMILLKDIRLARKQQVKGLGEIAHNLDEGLKRLDGMIPFLQGLMEEVCVDWNRHEFPPQKKEKKGGAK